MPVFMKERRDSEAGSAEAMDGRFWNEYRHFEVSLVYLPIVLSFDIICTLIYGGLIGSSTMTDGKPRQARKGAAVVIALCVGV